MKWFRHPSDLGSNSSIGTLIKVRWGIAGYGAFIMILESVAARMNLDTDPPTHNLPDKLWCYHLGFNRRRFQSFLLFLKEISAISYSSSDGQTEITISLLSELADARSISSSKRWASTGSLSGGPREDQSIEEQNESRTEKNKKTYKRREISGKAASCISSAYSNSKDSRPALVDALDLSSPARQMAAIYSKLRSVRSGQAYRVVRHSANMPHFSKAAQLCDEYQIGYLVGCTAIFDWYLEAGTEKEGKPYIPFPNQLHGENAALIVSELSGHVNETALLPADVDMQMAVLRMRNESM